MLAPGSQPRLPSSPPTPAAAARSPFLLADKIKKPILLIHGEDDNNPGTFPMQSERFFAALKGHGANVRLCMLPYEVRPPGGGTRAGWEASGGQFGPGAEGKRRKVLSIVLSPVSADRRVTPQLRTRREPQNR